MSLNGQQPLFTLIVFAGLALMLVGNSCGAKPHVQHSPPVAKDQHPSCKNSDMLHSDIVTNAILNAKREHANLTFLGRVQNMKECLGLCCFHKKCELAYLENNTQCFSTKCANSDLCRIIRNESNNGSNDVKISLMVKKEPSKRVYITAYIVMAMACFGAALSGTVWVVYVFVKKYQEKDEIESEKLVGEPQVY